MTGSELYTFTTDLLSGESISETLFYNLLNTARVIREDERPWQVLMAVDNSLEYTTQDDYDTAKDLPSNFVKFVRRTENQPQIILEEKSNANNTHEVLVIPNSQKRMYKKSNDYASIDMKNKKLYFLGTNNSINYKVYLNYIYRPEDIESTTEWDFPSEYHKILAYDVVAMYRGGVDYDDPNAQLCAYDRIIANQLLQAMYSWDDELALTNLGI